MKNRTTLKINLIEKKATYLKIPELNEYIGGEPAAIYLLSKFRENNPLENYLSFTTGPLTGVFPFASKGVFLESKESKYSISIGGGKLPALMNFAGIDSIEIIGKSEKPVIVVINDKEVQILPYLEKEVDLGPYGVSGRRSQVTFNNGTVLVDKYFKYSTKSQIVKESNLKGISFSPLTSKVIDDKEQYTELFNKIMQKEDELTVSSSSFPSCFGCPMGCAFSANKEITNTSILPRSLVSCGFAEAIYNDINTVFACFQILKYNYNHDFLESFAYKMGSFFKDFNNKLNS